MKNTFVNSVKTIAQSLIDKAGFDKTRSGKIVAKNDITNTYSVRIDGNIYANVRVVNDATYNVGDTVKVNMPCNQPTQMIIVSSIFSDASIGKKIGHAEKLIDAIDGSLEDVKEIDGHIYQLDIVSVFGASNATHTGHIYKDGIDVTDSTYWSKFKWYLMESSGKTAITDGISNATLTMALGTYLYGMALILEWVDANDNVLLRKRIILIDNAEVANVMDKATNAYNLADNTDNYFWMVESGTDTGAHITEVPKDEFITTPSGYNLLARSNGVALRNALNEMAIFTNDGVYFNGYVGGVWRQVAAYTSNYARIGDEDDYSVFIEPKSFSLLSAGTSLFNIAPSGNPTSDSYQFTEQVSGSYVRDYSLLNTPITNTTIECTFTYDANDPGLPFGNATMSFTAGSYTTKSQTIRGNTITITYSSPSNFVISASYTGAGNLGFRSFTYSMSSGNNIDLGKLTFGSRRSGNIGNNTSTLGNNLLASYNYQTVVGKYNDAEDKAFIVGVGTSTTLSNGFTVDWDGNMWAKNYYPINSYFVTKTNTNPSNILGFGTWELRHKVLSSMAGQSSNGEDGIIGDISTNYVGYITWNDTNTTKSVTDGGETHYRTATIVVRNGEIFLRIVWYNKVAPDDNIRELCVIDFPQFNSTPYNLRTAGTADGLNAIPIVGILWSGNASLGIKATVNVYDFVHSGTSYSTSTNQSCWVEFRLAYTDGQLDNNYCNEFHWIRTA